MGRRKDSLYVADAPALAQMAQEATRFREWLLNGHEATPEESLYQALQHLVSLYAAAAQICHFAEAPESSGLKMDVAKTDMDRVSKASRRIPLDYYGVVFNPLVVPAEAPVLGSLADDFLDIYRDVVRGHMLYEQKRLDEAAWEWAFNFRIHWGEHATGAIRAIHCKLMKSIP